MENILNKIKTYKIEEVKERKLKLPISSLESIFLLKTWWSSRLLVVTIVAPKLWREVKNFSGFPIPAKATNTTYKCNRLWLKDNVIAAKIGTVK